MAVKPRLNLDAYKAANEFIEKQLRRIYFVWAIGIAVGVVQVKLDSGISYQGVSVAIPSAEKLQGLIYCICLLIYLATAGMALIMAMQFIAIEKDQLRTSIYRALGSKKTLLGLTKQQHEMLRLQALAYLIFARVVIGGAFLLPLIHIVFLQQPTLVGGLDLVFHTQSLTPDGKLVLHSPIVLALTACFAAVWSGILNAWLLKSEPRFWNRAVSVCMFSIITLTGVDSVVRGISISDAFGRVIAAQIIVYILWIAPRGFFFLLSCCGSTHGSVGIGSRGI
ncbi:hypothetical protein ACVW1A_001339 [Bradyrhizobium sp. LB1.3]